MVNKVLRIPFSLKFLLLSSWGFELHDTGFCVVLTPAASVSLRTGHLPMSGRSFRGQKNSFLLGDPSLPLQGLTANAVRSCTLRGNGALGPPLFGGRGSAFWHPGRKTELTPSPPTPATDFRTGHLPSSTNRSNSVEEAAAASQGRGSSIRGRPCRTRGWILALVE